MIAVRHLSKQYGPALAVDDLTFEVRPGAVTGFLGPNGAGKTTTMRMILGLERPSAGQVTINGRSYADLVAPLREVGALIDAKAIHPGRSAYHHLLSLAQSNAIAPRRVRQVLELVGLEGVAGRRAGSYSLGMGQRLGIAAALLGDPPVVMLDEPVNGLDPEGILWARNLMRGLAAEGRTVLVSSHLMGEMALTADRLVVIGKGRLIADAGVDELVASSSASSVRAVSSDPEGLAALVARAGGTVRRRGADAMEITGLAQREVAQLAVDNRIVLYELVTQHASLEEAFMELTKDSVEYSARAGKEASWRL